MTSVALGKCTSASFLPSFLHLAAEAEALRLGVLSTPRAVYGFDIYIEDTSS
jgi:hypothetical protein